MDERQQRLLDGIDATYEAVIDERSWRDALDHASALAGSHGALLFSEDPIRRSELEITEMSHGFDPEGSGAKLYLDTLLDHPDERRWNEALEQAPARTVVDDTEIWPDRDAYDAMEATRWLNTMDFHHRAAIRLCDHGGWKDSVAVIYPRGRGPVTPTEREDVSCLVPHLARALEIRRPFSLLRRRYQAVLGVLDRLGIGVLVLVANDHILLANAEAERILDRADALRRSSDGRLAAVGPANEGTPADALFHSLSDVHAGRSPEGRTVYLPRRGGDAPYVADVSLFRESGLELGAPTVGAFLCLVDPEHSRTLSTEPLARVYGLTSAEADVCALILGGLSTGEIAEERSVSLETVKSQSKAILRKTSCRNRIELVKRAIGIAPPLLD